MRELDSPLYKSDSTREANQRIQNGRPAQVQKLADGLLFF